MRGGRRPTPKTEKIARGTARSDRPEFIVLPTEDGAVLPPEGSMTDEAMLVWELHAPPAILAGVLKPCDAEQFAVYCNLTAFIRQCHRAGEAAPAAHYAEQRRQAELFGLAGERSRLITGKPRPKSNPFLTNGVRPGK